jgi:hypothetical protein
LLPLIDTAPRPIRPLASPALAAGIAWWAHIGGFAFGAAYAFVANGFRTGAWTPTPGTSASHASVCLTSSYAASLDSLQVTKTRRAS